jgi:sirohydrochlorin ferrochelatase
MGVHGLHTFLEEHKGKVPVQSLNALAEAARKTAEAKKAAPTARVGHNEKKQPLLILVDGLSILMQLAQAVAEYVPNKSLFLSTTH